MMDSTQQVMYESLYLRSLPSSHSKYLSSHASHMTKVNKDQRVYFGIPEASLRNNANSRYTLTHRNPVLATNDESLLEDSEEVPETARKSDVRHNKRYDKLPDF
jgi:hypothetical protein